MNSFMSKASVLNCTAPAAAVSAGFCGEQAVSRAAQAANVIRRFKVDPSDSRCPNPYFAIRFRVRLNTVSGGLQKVTTALSVENSAGESDEIARLAARLRARHALGRS